jgi:transcriptional regulator with XRE-family HTH domain
MSAKNPSTRPQNLFTDSLASEIEESLKDPQYRAAFEDSSHRYRVIDLLVRLRKARKLTQKQVAERMGVGQSTVAGFENEGSDPRLSTVQRYARAVESRCVVTLQTSLECDWIPAPVRYHERAERAVTMHVDRSSPSPRAVGWARMFGLAA